MSRALLRVRAKVSIPSKTKNQILEGEISPKMFYRGGHYGSEFDERDMGPKRQRLVDQSPGSSYYRHSPAPSYIYNPPPLAPIIPPPSYAHTGQPPPFPVVRLRGLPFHCSEADIAELFHGLDIVDIFFVRKDGQFTGEGYCVLGYPLQVDFALQRTGMTIGRRYIEIFRCKRQDYYKAIANEVSEGHAGSSPPPPPRRKSSKAKSNDEGKDHPTEHTGILRMRGLPYSASKSQIVEFFKDFMLAEEAIHIPLNYEGRPTGEAYVEFASAEDSKAAMVKDRMSLGSRYIELFASTQEDMDEAMSRGR